MTKEVLAIDLANQLTVAWKANDIEAALEAINAPDLTPFEALKAGIYCEERTHIMSKWLVNVVSHHVGKDHLA